MPIDQSQFTRFLLLTVFAVLVAAVPSAIASDFSTDVRPILTKHCITCHGAKKQEGGLRLDQRAAALRGGDNYAPAIVPKSSETSPLWQFVSREDAELFILKARVVAGWVEPQALEDALAARAAALDAEEAELNAAGESEGTAVSRAEDLFKRSPDAAGSSEKS